MVRRKYDAKQTKDDILSEAKRLFSQKGYIATSIEDICVATGFSKGSLYHHFKSKEDLFIQLAEHAFANSWTMWDTQSSGYTTAIDKLYAYADFFVDTLDRSLTKAGAEFIVKVGADSIIGQRFFMVVMGYMERFEQLVAEGIMNGELKAEHPKELSFIVLSYFSGLSDSQGFLDKEAMKQLYRKATGLLLDGIRNTK